MDHLVRGLGAPSLPRRSGRRRWSSGAALVVSDDDAEAGSEDPKRQHPHQLDAENPDYGGVENSVVADGLAVPVQD